MDQVNQRLAEGMKQGVLLIVRNHRVIHSGPQGYFLPSLCTHKLAMDELLRRNRILETSHDVHSSSIERMKDDGMI